jgi:uncharacterized repeat protein (TIGR02543 family)
LRNNSNKEFVVKRKSFVCGGAAIAMTVWGILALGGCENPDASDTTAPAEVGSFNVAPGNAEATLSWTEPADADFAKVEITFTPAKDGIGFVAVDKGTSARTIGSLANGTVYTFTVKSVDEAGNKSAGVSATATPRVPVYTVTFNSNGGSPVAKGSAAAGGRVTKPKDPTKEGSNFGGWHSDQELTTEWNFNTGAVNADITLWAKWIPTYQVAFNTNGGSVVAPQTVAQDGKITKPSNPAKVGFNFGGWHSDEGLSVAWDFDTDTVSAALTLWAKWTPTYQVAFNTDGGSVVAPQTVAQGGKVTKPKDPAKEGFVFNGWSSDEGLTALWDFDTDTVSAAVTLWAKWNDIPPANVTNLGANGRTGQPTEVSLYWLEPRVADFDHVVITHNRSGGENSHTVNKQGTGNYVFHIWSGLIGSAEYTFTVKSVDAGGNMSSGVTVTATTTAYTKGQRGPAGGVIFYDKGSSSDGWRYLEMAPAQTGSVAWGASGQSVAYTSRDIGTGKTNTETIVSYLQNNGESGKAAQICDSLIAGGYDDWFLPSYDELSAMWLYLSVYSSDKAFFWSSTEYSTTNAVSFFTGGAGNGGNAQKTNVYGVWAVRRF